MKGGLAGIVLTIVAIFVLIALVKVAFKLAALAIVVGIGAAVYFAVRNRIGGGGAR
ncbi:MAG TPA: hypothetical protein VIT38_02950 [Allosphingosinicella sp.]|jgi:hypothetical protein